ncbi:MAG: LysR family transcriptional regulator [Myxococcota bacterium]
MSISPRVDRFIEFLAVADAGSVSAAARELGIPRATLSRRLSALEDALQVRLIHRETRQIGLTEAGALLAERARVVVSSAEEALRAVQATQARPAGLLRVSTPPAYLFTELLLGFAKAHLDVELQVVGTPTLVDLVADRVDVALRAGEVRQAGLVVRRLWNDRTSLVAAPRYLETRAPLTDAQQLKKHTCILGFESDWQPRRGWPLRTGGRVPVNSALTAHDVMVHLSGALAGYGIALLPESITAPYVKKGELVRVLTDQIGGNLRMSIVFTDRKYMPANVRAFIDYTVAFYEADPFPDGLRTAAWLMPPTGAVGAPDTVDVFPSLKV